MARVKGYPRRKVRAEVRKVVRGPGGKFTRGGFLDRLLSSRTVTYKRDCTTGRFLPPEERANQCGTSGTGPRKPALRARPGEDLSRVCYTTRGACARAMLQWNIRIAESASGADQLSSDGAYDSVNEKYELRGKRRVRTLGDAILACVPRDEPYCLDRFDLDTLNETRPGRDHGPFVLPDVVEEHKLNEKYRALIEEGGAEECHFCEKGGSDDVPF